MLQLNPPIWLDTPKGRGLAHIVINNGSESEFEFLCFMQNGELWSFSQSDVRACKNTTLGRDSPTPSAASS